MECHCWGCRCQWTTSQIVARGDKCGTIGDVLWVDLKVQPSGVNTWCHVITYFRSRWSESVLNITDQCFPFWKIVMRGWWLFSKKNPPFFKRLLKWWCLLKLTFRWAPSISFQTLINNTRATCLTIFFGPTVVYWGVYILYTLIDKLVFFFYLFVCATTGTLWIRKPVNMTCMRVLCPKSPCSARAPWSPIFLNFQNHRFKVKKNGTKTPKCR